jgi:hypothetical protein
MKKMAGEGMAPQVTTNEQPTTLPDITESSHVVIPKQLKHNLAKAISIGREVAGQRASCPPHA